MNVTPLSQQRDDSGPPLYELRGVSKSYGREDVAVRALDGVDLEIARGEYVVIAGPSGSGKSTLLQLLGALDRPTSGTISFRSRDLGSLPDRDLAALRLDTLGFVFQQFNLIPTLTASENVEIALAPTSIDAAGRSRRVHELLARVGLADRATHLPSQLSGGEQQRVAIARALANEPDVILADEPTGNLDSANGDAILALLYALWKETGSTVVLITHDPGVAGTAPRIVRLADGRIAGEEGAETSRRTAVSAGLAQHGVNGPPGGAPPSGQPPSGAIPGGQAPSGLMQRAFEACRQYAPQGAPGAPMAGPPPTSQSQ